MTSELNYTKFGQVIGAPAVQIDFTCYFVSNKGNTKATWSKIETNFDFFAPPST